LHTLHTRTASKKVAVAAHRLHLDTLTTFLTIPAGHVHWAINWPHRSLGVSWPEVAGWDDEAGH